MNINVDQRVFNDTFLPIVFSYDHPQHRYMVLMGGAGSGKSVFMTQRLVLRLLRERGHRLLVVRKVASTLRNSVYRLFKDVVSDWGLNKLFTFSDSYLTIQCVNGSEVVFAGLDNVEKMKSIAGITSIWIEETTELTETDFNQLDLRLRGVGQWHKEVCMTFNPISETHWLKRRFFDTVDPEICTLTTTYKDNRFLDPRYVKVLEDLKDSDPVYYSIYCLAQWGSTGNMVWSNYKVENISTDPLDYHQVVAGLDFGFNDPSACVLVGERDSEFYILKEFYQTGLTNTQLIDKLSEWKPYRMTADSAEPDRIKEFRQAGFNISPCHKSKHSVRHGIDFIRRHKIWVHPSCKHFLSEIAGYVYLKDHEGHPTEEPIGVNDHLMAALRYGTEVWNRQDSISFLK